MKISRSETLGFRKSHAFVIGIDKYHGIKDNLQSAENDAEAIAIRLKVLQDFDHVLLMKNASKKQLTILLDWLSMEVDERPKVLDIPTETFPNERLKFPKAHQYDAKAYWLDPKPSEAPASNESFTLSFNTGKNDFIEKTTLFPHSLPSIEIDIKPEEDSIVFFYAGHGFPSEDPNGPAGYIGPTDTLNIWQREDTKFPINDSLLSMDAIYQALAKAKCKHTLLILDCCYAGKFQFASTTTRGFQHNLMPLHEARYERYKSRKAFQVLVAADAHQKALDAIDASKNSPFTQTLMKALEGDADLALPNHQGKHKVDGIITAQELSLYVWEVVEKKTSEIKTQHPDLIEMEEHDKGQFIFLNPRIDPASYEFANNPDKNPYKGLLPYEPEDASLFFGRDKAINELIHQLGLGTKDTTDFPKLLFISAPSGTGKSSLVRAGLYPTLTKLYGFEQLITFRPNALERIVGQTILPTKKEEDEEVNTTITRPYEKVKWKGVEELEKQLVTNTKKLVLIDQFEDFFTNLTKEEQAVFENKLLELVNKSSQKKEATTFFIITMRSDVEWQLEKTIATIPAETITTPSVDTFSKYWQTAPIYRLKPMVLEELRQAITEPAWWALHDFKDAANSNPKDDGEELINKIVEDVDNYPASLPWLSCVMYTFYEKVKRESSEKILHRKYYDGVGGIGGVKGAISASAEAFYIYLASDEFYDYLIGKEKVNEALLKPSEKVLATYKDLTKEGFIKVTKAYQALMRSLILRMVGIGDAGFVRRKVTYNAQGTTDALIEISNGQKALQLNILVREMVARNLLVQGENNEDIPTLEPAHDALINYWPRCLKWIDEFGKENILLQRQLWEAVLERAKSNKE